MGLVLKESVARRIIVEHRADNPAGAGADEGPKENGGRAYALPPFVMRGCALLRLPDQKTMTGLRKQ